MSKIYKIKRNNKIELIDEITLLTENLQPLDNFETTDEELIEKGGFYFDDNEVFHFGEKPITDYKELRIKEYPSLQEQMDMQYHDKINNTNNWQTTIENIKIKYPKV